jgi:alpha-glucosidase
MVDFGYDISDFYTIQPEYGTSDDFDALVTKCKEIGIYLILDFVPNHTSNLHEWFIKSEKNETGYENYYVWHPGKVNATTGLREPPNNWISVFRFSAWEWSDIRQEYYLHQFVKEQPDLNYRDPNVVEAMKEVLRYWLQRGVSGFRIDAVPYLFEDENLLDEPRTNAENCDAESACYLQHIYTQDHPLTFDMAYQWRAVLDNYTATTGEPVVLLLEAYTSLSNIMKFYGNETTAGAGIPFNFELLSNTNINSTGRQFQTLVDGWMDAMPAGKISNWVVRLCLYRKKNTLIMLFNTITWG